jgi:hypothetical protein
LALAIPSTAFAGPKPTIQVFDPSTPYVTGSGFTPNGQIQLVEKNVGVKGKPLLKEVVSADGNGNLFAYLACGTAGDQQTVKAKDLTTHKGAKPSPPMSLGCIN